MSEPQCGQYLNIEDREHQCTLPADHSRYSRPTGKQYSAGRFASVVEVLASLIPKSLNRS